MYYNSLSHSREEVVRLHVTEPHVEIRDPRGNVIPSQLEPYWEERQTVSSVLYKVLLGLESFQTRGLAWGLTFKGLLLKNSQIIMSYFQGGLLLYYCRTLAIINYYGFIRI